MSYYDTLDVTKTATQEEIKKAYRKLAMKYHPDRTGGDDTKFKEIQLAYDTLGDPEKRRIYDSGGHNPQGHQDLNEIFRNFGFQFNDFFGSRQPKRNKDLQIKIMLSLVETLTEQTKTVSVETTKGNRETVEVRIPRGVTHNSTIKYPGLGDNFFDTLPRGDLYVQIALMPHPEFLISGIDVITNIDVNCLLAITGGETTVKGFDLKEFKLNIPPGIQTGQGLRIKDQGLYELHGSTRGSLVVRVNITVPTNLSTEQLDLIRQINTTQ